MKRNLVIFATTALACFLLTFFLGWGGVAIIGVFAAGWIIGHTGRATVER